MFSTDEQMAYGISRAIIKQALRDFHSIDVTKIEDVAQWISESDEYEMVCESAEIDPDYLSMFFLEMSKRPTVERKVLAENAISVLDSFSMEIPSAN
jgi:hypothetical protein|tara:strand:+ start:471 stop:761 length:291 start_codon:yes stop_codon:yes gene_type:complete